MATTATQQQVHKALAKANAEAALRLLDRGHGDGALQHLEDALRQLRAAQAQAGGR